MSYQSLVNKKKTLIGIFIGIVVVSSLLIINQFLIHSRIYYRISYNGDINDLDKIVEKSEYFDYPMYCKYRNTFGIVYNLANSEYVHYIDNDFITNLKAQITYDREKFHIFPFYEHHFALSFEATNESLLYLSYNNDSIIKLEDQNHTEIFSALEGHYENSSTFWEGSWYLNFTLLPFSPISNSIIQLNDSILVKMNLDYEYYYGFNGAENIIVEQYLCFNSNHHIIFVSIPKAYLIVA